MATSKDINNLVINKVENQQVYDYMVQNNLVNSDELYLVEDGDEEKIVIDASLSSTSENPVQNKVITSEFSKYETKNDAEAKLGEAYTYTDTKTSDMATNSGVDSKISSHNISSTAHNDIRDLISGLTTRLNTLADSDDTTLDQLSEIVTYIKSNKSLIDSITTNKVNVSDIINNLTTNVTNKPLSAAQGVAIKTLIDDLQDEVDSHTHTVTDITDLTVSAEEINHLDGVTSNVQAQLDGAMAAVEDVKIPAMTTNNEELKINSLNVEIGGSDCWTQLDDLPYDFYSGCAVVYNNEIHLIGGKPENISSKYHYKFNGTTWTRLGDLPYDFYQGCAVVYDGEIHLLGGLYVSQNNHYKFNGTSWIKVGTLPYQLYNGCAVVYNNEIHIMGGHGGYYTHYKYNGSTWTQLDNLPYQFLFGCAIVYNNEIHIMGSMNYGYLHYKYNGTSWSQLEDVPYFAGDGSLIIWNGDINLLRGTFRYGYDGVNWTQLEDLPYYIDSSSIVVYNNQIHIMGSNQASNYRYHYKLITTIDKLLSFTIDENTTIPFITITDGISSETTTYSSKKIDELLDGANNINDTISSTTTTYSSNKIENLLDEKMDANIILEVNRGGTGYSTIADTTYSTARYRASSLHSSEKTPTTNGVIAWTYE